MPNMRSLLQMDMPQFIIAMLQTVPSASHNTDSYAAYAENFDLSLLPMDGDVSIDTQFQANTLQNQDFLYPGLNQNNYLRASTPDYIPTTIQSAVFIDTKCAADKNRATNNFQDLQFCATGLPLSPPQDSGIATFTPSPSPPIEFTNQLFVKQEQNSYFGLYPPSPPDSNGAPSPIGHYSIDIKTEPYEIGPEPCLDLSTLFGNTFDSVATVSPSPVVPQRKDHQLLREYLQDTTFQRKHNLKPLALESLFVGDWGSRGDIEPVISLALEHARKDVQDTCMALNLSADPQDWTQEQTQTWLQFTMKQFKLSSVSNLEQIFHENGAELSRLSDVDFINRIPQAGATLHAQLEIWKAACSDSQAQQQPTAQSSHNQEANITSQQANMPSWDQPMDFECIKQNIKTDIDDLDDISDQSPASSFMCNITVDIPPSASPVSPIDVAPSTPHSTSAEQTPVQKPAGRQGSAHIHLWQFLKELLASPQNHGTAIRWLDRPKGVFKIEDSVRVARLWGRRKNRPAMNYDKLSRSIRQYYKKGIMKKTERSQRLVYQFCPPYAM